MKERTLERKKAEEVKGKGRKDKIKAKRKDEIELEKAQSVLTSGGIIRRHDLLLDATVATRDANFTTHSFFYKHTLFWAEPRRA